MLKNTRNWLLAGLVGLLVACSGGGGGNSASGVEPGPTPPGGTVPPPPPTQPAPFAPYEKAETLLATITNVTLDADDRAIVEWQLTDGNGTAIVDLGASNVRFTIAKLMGSPLGGLTGTWQSYQNNVAEPRPGVGTGSEQRLQATYERYDEDNASEFTNNGDGTYRYHFDLSLTNLSEEVLAQAEVEGLNLDYEPGLTHRVAMQFDGSDGWANPHYDWEPATGATTGLFTMDIAATDNCNRCHDPLGIHGGGIGPRREVQYCVTCHNPGTTDPESGNTVDMKVMIHKIHMGINLPSVQNGGEYVIYGFGGSAHDYSQVVYPQDIRNCVNCHVGTGTVGEREDLTLTSQGDNWAEVPTAAACGSCHDDELGPDDHIGSKPNDSGCASCHSEGGKAGSVQYSHRIEVAEARKTLKAEVTRVDNSGLGETPTITFKVTNPQDDDKPYDIHNDEIFTADGARLAVGMAWSTSDYTNAGNDQHDASQVQEDALANATANGDGTYSVVMPSAIPGNVRDADGSGVATVEGHPIIELDANNDGTTGPESVPVGDATTFFSINEPDAEPEERRVSVELAKCNTCHETLALHGDNRSDNINSCVSCHNPRNTDREVRELGKELGRAQATDGKDEESIDFKTMIHGIHAAKMRDNPLQIVGFQAFNLHVYDTEHVHYPGNLANCVTCHTEDGFQLPLAASVLGTSVDTGKDAVGPEDDLVTTPVTAVCSSCHDTSDNRDHMTFYGGDFSTTQAAIDSGKSHEDCNSCHREGSSIADAWELHQTFLE